MAGAGSSIRCGDRFGDRTLSWDATLFGGAATLTTFVEIERRG